MKLYILRHGTTEWNNMHLIQGQTDIPLDDFGRLMAKATGEGLKAKGITFDKVYSSPLKRSAETAGIVLGQHEDIIFDDRLKELNFGFMDGGNVEEMTADENLPFRFFKSAPDEYEEAILNWRRDNILSDESPELLSELCGRAKVFLTTVIEPMALKYSSNATACSMNINPSILISTHGALSKALLMHIRGEKNLAAFWGEGLLLNCGIAIVNLQIKNGKPDYHIENPAAVFYDESIKAKAPKLL